MPFYPQVWDLSQWKELGFQSLEDARYWQESSCGVLCLKMAVDAFLEQTRVLSISDFIREGLKIEAYTHKNGWSHEGLANLATQFGLKSYAKSGITPQFLKEKLVEGSFAVISIRWAFRKNRKSLKERVLFWKKFGGHMALVVGFESVDNEIKGFHVHHTSTNPSYNWKYRFIPLEPFMNGFNGKGGFTGRGVFIGL